MLQSRRGRFPVVKVVEITAPIVVKADVSNFRSLVQQLTGKEDRNFRTKPTPSAFCEQILKRRKRSSFGSESDCIRKIVSSSDLKHTEDEDLPDDLPYLQPSVSISETEIEKKSCSESALSIECQDNGSTTGDIENSYISEAHEQQGTMTDLNSEKSMRRFSDFEDEEVPTGLLLEGMEEIADLLFPESARGSMMWAAQEATSKHIL